MDFFKVTDSPQFIVTVKPVTGTLGIYRLGQIVSTFFCTSRRKNVCTFYSRSFM